MGAHPTSHPTDQTLSSYGLGKLDDASAKAVDKHLEQCAGCRQRVAEMSADSFLERVRAGQEPPDDSTSGHSLLGDVPGNNIAKAPAPPPASTLPPGLADHPDYEILRELGRGGMGVVYLAHNTLMGRDEVLKVMGRHVIERPGVLDRFRREIRAVAKLRHPNIVTAYHATRVGESIVFAMEYVEGLDLSRMVKAKGPLPVAHACNFVYQAALGLQHAHEEGLVHRDIKPGNLMLSSKRTKATIKILDFGLAKATRDEKVDSSLTSDGQTMGTPDFIAPEQIIDAQRAEIRADIYSLGATLYYLLTGRPPFEAKSVHEVYQAHISRDADPLNLIRPEVPVELAALVAKMLAKEPSRRFQQPGEVAEALTPFFKRGSDVLKDASPELSLAKQSGARPPRLRPGAARTGRARRMAARPVSEVGKLSPAAPTSNLEAAIDIRTTEPLRSRSDGELTGLNSWPHGLIGRHRPGACVVLGVFGAVLLRFVVVISSLVPLGGRGTAVLEARLPSMGMVLAVIGIAAAVFLGGRRLNWRDQFACVFTGASLGLFLAAIGYALIRTLEPPLGRWSSSLVAVGMLWAAVGAVLGIVFATLISRTTETPQLAD